MITKIIKFFKPTEKKITEKTEKEEKLMFKNLEISKIRKEKNLVIESLEKKTQELEKKREEIRNSRNSLLNILEDLEENEKIIKNQQKILNDVIEYFFHGIILFGKNQKILLINSTTFKMLAIAKDLKEKILEKKNYKELKKNENYLKILNFLKQKNILEKEISFNKYHLNLKKIIFDKNKEIDYLLILNDITKEKDIQQMQSDFLALTAHQLRTPLSGIRWTLEMFLDGSLGKIDREQRKYIQQLADNSKKLIKIINKFLDVAQIQEGKVIANKEMSDIINLTNTVIDLIKPLLEEKKIDIKFNCEKKKETVRIDKEKIKLVIQNLLENAIKYSKKGSTIKINIKNNKKYLIFSIQDNGYGIPTEEQRKIFTKFFRGSNIKKIDTDGSGLGLFVIKNIIEGHNGSISFKSDGKNKGTTFYFRLPI